MTRVSQRESKSVSERAYAVVRASIVNLSLAPGTAMSEKEISEKLGVSRTPVRESFIKLAKEGLVDIYPQKGTVVSRIDYDSALEERFLREALERAVVERFIAVRTDEMIEALRKSIELQREAVEKGDLTAFLDLDDGFHGAFFEGAKKSMCFEVCTSVSGNYRRLRFLSLYVTDVVSTIIGQHEELVSAIERGDNKSAQEVLKRHIRNVTDAKDSLMQKYPDFFTTRGERTELLESETGLKWNTKLL